MGSHKRGRRDLATKQQGDKHNFFFELYVLSLQCFKGILPSLNSHHPVKYVNVWNEYKSYWIYFPCLISP